MYEYNAQVINVVDADTVDARVDVGFNITIVERLRLAKIDAPEIRTDAGRAAKTWVIKELLKHNMWVRISTDKDDSFGRWIAEIYLGVDKLHTGPVELVSLNDEMVRLGYAVYKSY